MWIYDHWEKRLFCWTPPTYHKQILTQCREPVVIIRQFEFVVPFQDFLVPASSDPNRHSRTRKVKWHSFDASLVVTNALHKNLKNWLGIDSLEYEVGLISSATRNDKHWSLDMHKNHQHFNHEIKLCGGNA